MDELQRLAIAHNPVARIQAKEAARPIRKMTRLEEKLSSVARACVLSASNPRIVGLIQSA